MTFKWVCVNVMEKVPYNLTEGYELPNYMRVVSEPKPYNATIVGNGGCFRDGNYSFITDGKGFPLWGSIMPMERIIFYTQKLGIGVEWFCPCSANNHPQS